MVMGEEAGEVHVTLPSRKEIYRRLSRIDDSPHMRNTLIPHLAVHAGVRVSLRVLVQMLHRMLFTCTVDVSDDIVHALNGKIPLCIAALIDDQSAATQFQELWSTIEDAWVRNRTVF